MEAPKASVRQMGHQVHSGFSCGSFPSVRLGTLSRAYSQLKLNPPDPRITCDPWGATRLILGSQPVIVTPCPEMPNYVPQMRLKPPQGKFGFVQTRLVSLDVLAVVFSPSTISLAFSLCFCPLKQTTGEITRGPLGGVHGHRGHLPPGSDPADCGGQGRVCRGRREREHARAPATGAWFFVFPPKAG